MDLRRGDRRELLRRSDETDHDAGHEPPYRAAAILAAVTIKNWRQLRARLALAGITDPLRQLGMHQLLDIVEGILEEGKDSKELARLRRDLYKPDPTETGPVAGFTPDEEMSSFRSMQAQFAAFGK
ncbi:DUF7240 domain-containing protein [Nocardia sp. CA-290969]|uniref:DUF7240 domain-containing protein n=1 Tax=Nocardia sp. CA-290969 TaxID=3239986 RepID=UPI003D92093A